MTLPPQAPPPQPSAYLIQTYYKSITPANLFQGLLIAFPPFSVPNLKEIVQWLAWAWILNFFKVFPNFSSLLENTDPGKQFAPEGVIFLQKKKDPEKGRNIYY